MPTACSILYDNVRLAQYVPTNIAASRRRDKLALHNAHALLLNCAPVVLVVVVVAGKVVAVVVEVFVADVVVDVTGKVVVVMWSARVITSCIREPYVLGNGASKLRPWRPTYANHAFCITSSSSRSSASPAFPTFVHCVPASSCSSNMESIIFTDGKATGNNGMCIC